MITGLDTIMDYMPLALGILCLAEAGILAYIRSLEKKLEKLRRDHEN